MTRLLLFILKGGNALHTDICGICPSEATTVSVNEPWQVLTMHAAGSEELCVIMHPEEELSVACKVLNESAHVLLDVCL